MDVAVPARRSELRPLFHAAALLCAAATWWLAGAAVLSGCRAREQSARADPDGGTEPGLRVPLPPGWVAMAQSADVLQLGPPGKAVLRIERVQAEELPRLADLQSNFSSELRNAHVRTVEQREDETGVLWRAQLEPRGGKGSPRPAAMMLGARRVGGGVVLCSTLPGATEAEVEAASHACDVLGR